MRIKKIVASALVAIMILTIIGPMRKSGTVYAQTIITPPAKTHPRVLFTSDDIPEIKGSLTSQQNRIAFARVKNFSSQFMYDGLTGNSGGKCNTTLLVKIESLAFYYALFGDDSYGEKAVSCILDFLSTCGSTATDFGSSDVNQSRTAGLVIYVSSEVYDWCYDKFTTAQRNTLISRCEEIAEFMEMNYPVPNMSPVNGHGAEAQLLRDFMAFAIATYDERPDIWQNMATRFYDDYVPFRQWLYKGHYQVEGDSYGLYRHAWDCWAYLLITGMGAEEPYSGEDLAQSSYGSIYMRRPDGQWMRDGDTSADTTNTMWNYWTDFQQAVMLDSMIGKDPYQKQEFARRAKGMTGFYERSPVMNLVFNRGETATIEPAALDNLPLSKHFGYPAGLSVARTGWSDGVDSPDVVAEMKVGGASLNNHQHLDAGHFQIYYKGILASDSGVYQGRQNDKNDGGTAYSSPHHSVYATKSVAHNTMLVCDPNEYTGTSTNRKYTRDGGQYFPNDGQVQSDLESIESKNVVATVAAQEIDPKNPNEPLYTYIKGDLKNAYSSKVSNYTRSFVFLNMKNTEVPGVMIVYDRITSTDTGYTKKWLLHGIEEPTINGKQTIFRRTYSDSSANEAYNGKMTVDTLLPLNSKIEKIGGSDSDGSDSMIWDRGKNTKFAGYKALSETDEGSTWRIEVSPKTGSRLDHFLNVIQVSDNDKNYYMQPETINTDDICGTVINDRVVTFAKGAEKIKKDITFTVSGSGKKHYTICDVEKGTWFVHTADGTIRVVASEEGGVLSFDANAGEIDLEFYSQSGNAIEYKPVYRNNKHYATRIDKRFVYNKAEPKMINDEFVMPLSTIEKYFKLSHSKSGSNITVTNGKFEATLCENSNNITTNSMGSENVYANTVAYTDIATGEFMIPAKEVIELFGGEFEYDELSSSAYITAPTYAVEPSKNEYGIRYSVDNGKTYQFIPNFSSTTYDYDITLPNNVYKVIVDIAGTKEPTAIQAASILRTGTNYNPNIGDALVGDFHNKTYTSAFSTEYVLPVDLPNSRHAQIPISNEESECRIYYNGTSYNIIFRSKQPRLTELIQDSDFNLGRSSTSKNDVVFIGGAAANNDNRSLIDTSETVVNGQTYAGTTWALANISKDLEGASMFILPETQMADSVNSRGNRNRELFSFKADTSGKVVVLTANEAGSNSVYYKEEDGWKKGADNGKTPGGINTTIGSFSMRTYNNFTTPQYYATAIAWKGNNNRGAQRFNDYRLVNPGIEGAVSSSHISKAYKLNYSYEKSFKAGESVSVNSTAILTYVSSNNPASNYAGSQNNVFAVFVIWDNEEKINILDYKASAGNGVSVSLTTSSQNMLVDNCDIYSVIYDNDRVVAVRKSQYYEGDNMFYFDYNPKGTETVKFFVFEHNKICPVHNYIGPYKIE